MIAENAFVRTAFRVGRQAILALAGLLCLSAAQVAASSPVLEQAARGVEAHRKADATIRVVRSDGTAVPGAAIEVVQRTHDFAFGNLFRPRHYKNERYRARFLELFNFIQLLEFNWGQYEREEGKPKLAERREFIDGWCREHGLTRFYGHMLVWAYQQDEDRDIGPVNPFWLFRYDRDTQFRLLQERIQREVRAYRDVDILWDVVNEPIHCRRWGDWDKPNDVDEPIADVLPYVRDALRWAHEADPDARLLINEYRILPAEPISRALPRTRRSPEKGKGAAACRRHPGALAGQRRALVFARGNLADLRALWHATRLSDLLHRILAGLRPAADGVRRAPGRQVESRAASRRDRTILSRRLRASCSAGHHLLRHDRRRNREPDPRPARRELPAQARLEPPQATDQGGVDHTPIGDHGRRGRLSFPRLLRAI